MDNFPQPPDKQEHAVVVGKISNPIRTFPYKRWLLIGAIVFVTFALGYLAYKPAYNFFADLYRQYLNDTNYQELPADTPAPATTKKKSTNKKSSASSQQSTSNQKKSVIYCGVSGMPKQVCTIAKSVESGGLKNNSAVIAMTDSIPDGTTVDLDFNSWSMEDEEAGYMDGKATAYGISKSGYLTFRLLNGDWKITSVDLN